MPSIFENGGLIGKINNYSLYKPLTFVGGSATGVAGTTSNINFSLTSLTGGLATAPADGDLVIAVICIGSTTDRSYRISGYNQVSDILVTDTEVTNLQVGYKFMTSTPDTQVTITGGSGSSFDGIAIAIHVWRNVDTVTPLDVTSVEATFTNTANPNPSAITPVTKGAQILVAGGSATTLVTTYNSPSYLSNFFTASGSDTNDATVGLGYVPWSGGSYDPNAWTIIGTDNTAFSTAAVTMALRPAPNIPSGVFNLDAVINGLA